MERMTFYIPPVFLFGNKVRHIKHNQERNKAEYKTATSTEIQIENRNIKRIEELEKENRKLKLHIEAKDKAYISLLKDYEELKEDRKKILDEIEAGIERFKAFRNR